MRPVFNIGFPMLVDTIDDAVGARYSGMPGRLYLIDRDGKVAFKSGRGPYLFKPAELEQSLILLLEQDAAAKVTQQSGLDWCVENAALKTRAAIPIPPFLVRGSLLRGSASPQRGSPPFLVRGTALFRSPSPQRGEGSGVRGRA